MSARSVTGHDLVIRGIAAYGLAGSMLDLPPAPLEDEAFAALLGQVRMSRLSGLLWQAAADGAMPVTDTQADQAEWLHVQALSAMLVLERLLISTAELLADAQVPMRVLKGTAYGHLDYPDPALRTFGDIDLMVPSDSFDAAVAALTGQNHRRLHPQPRPGFDRRFSKGTSFRTSDGLEIDLHRSFSMGPLGVRLDLARLWEREEAFVLGDTRLLALGPEERFLHACYHAVLGEMRPRLVPLRDVAQIALTRDLDLPRVHALIRASRAEAVVARAVRFAWSEYDIADVLAISAWAHAYRTDPREAAELAAYGEGSSYATKAIAAVRSLPSLSERISYLYALLLPKRTYLDRRDDGRIERLVGAYRERHRRRDSR